MQSESKEDAAFGFKGAIADRAALLAGGADHAELKSDYERFCQASGTRNMNLEGVRCPESQVGDYSVSDLTKAVKDGRVRGEAKVHSQLWVGVGSPNFGIILLLSLVHVQQTTL